MFGFLARLFRLHSGHVCPASGQYTWSQEPHDQRTCVEGKVMPPPPKGQRGGYWRLTDRTRTSHEP
jgi:hypothetical protein